MWFICDRYLMNMQVYGFSGLYCVAIVILAVDMLASAQLESHKAKHLYVSHSIGRDSQSCGSQSNPCKTIVMGVRRVQHNGQVNVDGTGSETKPYTCNSSAVGSSGIYSNKSMVIIGVQVIPHVKCQEGYDFRFGQSLLDHNETTVALTNLQFVQTSVTAQDVSLHIDNCTFIESTQAVNLVQYTSAVSLVFKNSLCVNVSSCIVTSVNQKIELTNQVSIYVAHSNITTSTPSEDQSIIHVTSPAGEYDEPWSISCRITLINVTFSLNALGPKGLILMDLKDGFTSIHLKDVYFFNSITAQTDSLIIVNNSYSHDTVINNTRFQQNYQGSCRALQVETESRNSLHIVNSQLENFQIESDVGGLFYLHSDHDSQVYIVNSTFTNNNVMKNGGCLALTSQNTKITIDNSTFINNFVGGCGAVMWVSVEDQSLTTIQGCYFESNSAGGPAGLASLQGSDINLKILKSKIIEITSRFSGGAFDIGYTRCGSKKKTNDVSIYVKDVEVDGSSSNGPGGLVVVEASNGFITIKDSSMKNIRATGPGGAFAAYFTSKNSQVTEVKIINSVFKNITTPTAPGGVFQLVDVRELTMDGTIIDTAVAEGGPVVSMRFDKIIDVIVNINNSLIKNCISTDGPGGAMQFAYTTSLQITNTVFDSNTALFIHGGCLDLSIGASDVLMRNVTFKYCRSLRDKGGAISFSGGGATISIDSCMFINNEAPKGEAGAISFAFSDRDKIINPGCVGIRGSNTRSRYKGGTPVSHRVWSYNTTITISNTVFIGNAAISGGALSLSRGSYTLQNCSFIDNFAKIEGGHIFVTSDSTNLTILHSLFLQQRSSKKVILPKENETFKLGSFIDSQSEGPLMIFDSSLEFKSLGSFSNTLVTVSNANYVNFGENNQTVLICPRGYELDILNMTTKIDTEYQSLGCKINLDVMQFNCKPCGIGTYSLQHGQSLGTNLVSGFQCLPCPFGAECLSQISAKPNFWGYTVQENPPGLNFTLCPLGYCKQPDKQDLSDYNSCHGNRTGPLCGKCKGGYTETLLSTSCRLQDDCRDTWLWGAAVAMIMLMALYLIHKPRLLRMLKSHILWFRSNTCEDEKEDDGGGGYLKIVFYFYQVTNILLITTSYKNIFESHLLQPVVGLFNFEIRLSPSGFLCPFAGLTVVTKQLLLACPVFGVLLMIALCYGCHCLLHKCTSRFPPTLGPYIGAALETLLLGYAVLANTALKLLRCTSLDQETRLFIAGNVLCYQWWQYVLVVFVALVIFPFVINLALGSRWLYKDSISIKEFFIGCVLPLPYLMYKLFSSLCGQQEPKREPPAEWKAPVTAILYGPFRYPQDDTAGAIYWESILVFRRLVLILITVFVSDPLSKELLLTLSCFIILLHHTVVLPFRSQAANTAEMLSLFGLVVIAMLNTFSASFLSTGQVPKGPLQSLAHVLSWIQVVILSALPVLCILAVVAVIVSQLIRLVIKVCRLVTCSCIMSRGWYLRGKKGQLLI